MITFLLTKIPTFRQLQANYLAARSELEDRRKYVDKLILELRYAKEEIAGLKAFPRENLHKALEAERAKRNRTWVRSPAEMTEGDLKRAFDVPNAAPLWRAVHQVLDHEIQDAIDKATEEPSATCTAEHRTFRNGGIDFLRQFQKELLDRQAAAQKADEDLDPEKEKL